MGPLIDSATLAARLTHVLVLDVRWRLGGPSTYPEFLDGHIPGAVWTDLDADFADPPGPGGRHPLPEPGRLQQRLRELGTQDDSAVVVYDEADSTAAARAWWVLRWAGLSQVAVLDGGLGAWRTLGYPLEHGQASPRRAGTVTVRPGAMPTLDAVAAAECARTGLLLDARTGPRYRGDAEPIDPVAGHIPGARNAPTTDNVRTDGQFLSASQLRERFAALGAKASNAVGAYCGSGVTAAHTVLALEHAGISAALYPGSWSEWISDPHRPVATGPEPG